jgi:GGDEF domain-containing protein
MADLQAQAFTDAVTGLGNERAYDLDLRRELARAARHGRALTVARISVEGLDVALGGDDALRHVGRALSSIAGTEVHAYRVALSQFAVLLPNVVPVDLGFVVGPLAAAGVGRVSVGMATYPNDPLDDLDRLAGRRLRSAPLPSRKRVRQQGGSDL